MSGTTLLSVLNNGAGVDSPVVLTATTAAPANGRYTDALAASFDPAGAPITPVVFFVKVNGTELPIAVTSTAQADNDSALDLANDLNDALAAAGLGAKLAVDLNSSGNLRFTGIDPSVSTLTITAAFGAFGASRTITGTVDLPAGGKYQSAGNTIAVALDFNVNGVTTAVASRSRAQDGTPGTTPPVPANTTRADLVADWNQALTAAGLGSKVVAELFGNALSFRVIDSAVTTFAITGTPTAPGFAAGDSTFSLLTSAAAPVSGKYPGAVAFRITLNGVVKTVTISAAAQTTNNDANALIADFTLPSPRPASTRSSKRCSAAARSSSAPRRHLRRRPPSSR